MRLLLRAAFWLSVVAVLLPTAPAGKQDSAPPVSAGEAVAAANAAVSDMSQFCARQPNACEVGSHAAAAFGDKVKAGAKRLYEYVAERLAAENTGSTGGTKSASPAKLPANTLTPADSALPWRGPQLKDGEAKRGS